MEDKEKIIYITGRESNRKKSKYILEYPGKI